MKQKRSNPPAGPAVLDSSAVLAYLRQETGANVVGGCLNGAYLSTVNLSEVLAKTIEFGGDDGLARELLVGFNVRFVDFTEHHAAIAANLREKTRPFGLSIGDRACLAVGIATGMEVLTADRAWFDAGTGAQVRIIR